MKAIEAGTGKKPKPFLRAKSFKADAVWNSKADKKDKSAGKNDKDEDPEPVKPKAAAS